ncbi:MAG TPA: cytochrome b/b6 domain-containing protein [Bacteroidota bacterium]|nr:cytochrome b/b6 domain-containing protein [Bacteroidota bacterium]
MKTSHRFVVIGLLCVLLVLPVEVVIAQSRADCLACHSDLSLTMEKEGKTVSIGVDEKILNSSPHKNLACIACHTGFDPGNIPHKQTITPVNCITCHSDAPFKHPFHPQLAEAYTSHQAPDVSCKDCHGTHDIVSPKVEGSKFSAARVVESCGECHGDVKEDYQKSSHGMAIAAKVNGAPNCLTCHRNPIVPTGTSQDTVALKLAQEKLCLSCHLDNPDVRARMAPSAGFIAAYENSVHGKALSGGNPRAANCIDCHGSHQMMKGVEPASLVNRANIPNTCGKCHSDIAEQYRQSVHGVAVAKGVKDAPVCTDCHGEHNILKHGDPRSPVAAANVSSQVCSPCHSSVRLSSKYGIAGDRSQTFADSYHGLAIRGGAVEVANCASCHSAHNIKPSSDPTSTVNKANLAVTCGKCHPGANAKFAVGAVHVAMASKEDPTLYWISTMYIILIVSVIGGMVIHNLLDFIRKSRRKLMIRRGLVMEEHLGHTLYVRMTISERLQHGALLISFFLLVLTGFMLRYPEAWWVVALRSIDDHLFTLRSLVHRCSAVVMVAAGLYHLYYVTATERGRNLIRDLLPRLQDVRDAVNVLKYNLGISPFKPRFGRFSYIEKSEYWALVWGTIIMAATGIVMWFDNTFIGLFTKLGYDISRTIHFYEAWLATLAIFVWHIYYVIFNPDIYPLNLAFLKGTITEAEMEEEHPLELEEINRQMIEDELSAGTPEEEEKPSSSIDSEQAKPGVKKSL